MTIIKDKDLEEAAELAGEAYVQRRCRSIQGYKGQQESMIRDREVPAFKDAFLAGAKWAYENPKQEDGYIFKGYTVQLLDPFGKIYWQATMLPERKE